jgi:hypothetical protein
VLEPQSKQCHITEQVVFPTPSKSHKRHAPEVPDHGEVLPGLEAERRWGLCVVERCQLELVHRDAQLRQPWESDNRHTPKLPPTP